jgi:Peptidase propeptide and YPEB domain
MRKKAAITGGVAAAVLGGGLVLALNGGGTASAERTAATPARPAAAVSPSATSIGRAEAERIALTAVPGGQVRSAELETEHGVPVWSVRVVKAGVTHDLDIDARTGELIRDRDDRRAGHPEAEHRHDRARETEHRHGEAEQRHDRAREAGHRHGADDGPGHDVADDHGGHGGDDGHRGHGG